MCQGIIVELPQSTTMSWQLGVRTAQKKPKYLVIGIQVDKSGDQDHNASLFDHNNVRCSE